MSVTEVGTPGAVQIQSGSSSGNVTGAFSGTQPRTAGDLLVACVTAFGSTAAGAISTPSGWTQVAAEVSASGRNRTATYTKVAAGSDAAPNFTSALSGTAAQARMSCEMYELTGQDGTTPVVTTGAATGTGVFTISIVTSGNVPAAGCFGIDNVNIVESTVTTLTYTADSGWTSTFDQGSVSARSHSASATISNPASGSTLTDAPSYSGGSNSDFTGVTIVVQPPVGTIPGAAALTGGAGVLGAAATLTIPATAALAGGAGILAAAATETLQGAAALAGGAGALTAAGVIAGAAAPAGGAGILTAAGIPSIPGVAALAGGAGALTAAGHRTLQAAAALHGGAGVLQAVGGAFTLALIASITGQAGTDQFGNQYRAGITEYDPVGLTLVNLLTGMINLNATPAGTPADNDGSLGFQTSAGAFRTALSSPWPNSGDPCVLELFGGALPEATFSGPLKASVSGSPESWHAMSLQNSWAPTGSGPGALYRLTPENEVQISAALNCTGATVADGTLIATLPAAYQPASTHTFAVACDELRIASGSNNEGARFSLNAAGQLTCFGIAAGATSVGIEVRIPLDI